MNRRTSITSPEKAWATDFEDILNDLQSDKEKGLTRAEVKKRLEKFGANQLRKHERKSIWQILVDQFKSLIILLLAVAAAVSFLYNEILEGWAITVVILINTAIGFFTELRAVLSMEALYKLGRVETRVRRNGEVKQIDARDLVPGDIILFEGGDVITADIRIIEASKLQADESPLTGESMPVGKEAEPVEKGTVLGDRTSMLYKGTSITRGSGEGVVVSTGQETELGHISSLVEDAEEEQTPLEKRLDKLGYRLLLLTLVITVFISISGILSGKETFLMIQTGIALAVAAIPEGLPIVATIALAKGMRIMARKNALINRLSSVETLGATETIFSDKTGTLTENKMSVTRLLLSEQELDPESVSFETNGEDKDAKLALETGVFCNNATYSDDQDESSGDPLEVALLEAGHLAGIEQEELLEQYPEAREEAFDPEVKMMATWNNMGTGHYRISVKGAPDTVLEHCESFLRNGEKLSLSKEEKSKWKTINEELAEDGLRVIALAYRDTDTTEGNPYKNLVFVGMVGLLDPPRRDVKSSIEACKEAGIRVVMVTGDQPQTAEFIAKSVGLATEEHAEVIHGQDLPSPKELESSPKDTQQIMGANIFARISPKQKLDLIELYQNNGHVVGMTGDGVNDAPALKKADIGIAMGQRGTQVAREASHMVLTDDAFSTIVTAIKQGRVIFDNIRKFVIYLLSGNVGEIMAVAIASFLSIQVGGVEVLPLLPLQILYLNLLNDVFPALALGIGPGDPVVMRQPPRSADEPIITRFHWGEIMGYGVLIGATILGVYFWAIYGALLGPDEIVTVSFLSLSIARLLHVFNMRRPESGFIRNEITQNLWIWAALALDIGLLLLAVYWTPLASVLKVTAPNATMWMLVAVASIVPLIGGQIYLAYRKRTDQYES